MENMDRVLTLIANGDIDNAEEYIIAGAHTITAADAERIMLAVRATDPQEAGDAAQIRDALRDNTELTIN